MNELLKDPKSLKESIKAKIKDMVYKPKKTVARKPAVKKPVIKKTITEKTIEELANSMSGHRNPPTPTKKVRVKKEAEQQ
jgi:hypothetical protein